MAEIVYHDLKDEKSNFEKAVEFPREIKEQWKDVPEVSRIQELDDAIEAVENCRFGSLEQLIALKEFAKVYGDEVCIDPIVKYACDLETIAYHCYQQQGDEAFKDLANDFREMYEDAESRFWEERDLEPSGIDKSWNMEKFQIMMGVSPGYFIKNPTAQEAMEKAKEFINKRLVDELYPAITIFPAAAVYNRQWGCPEGGEVGVTISGSVDSFGKRDLEKQMSLLMADLGQSTATIEYDNDGKMSSAYIRNSYKKDTERNANTLANTDISRSDNDLRFMLAIKGNYMDIGAEIQNMLEKVNPEDYAVTGYMRDATTVVSYEGTMRPDYGQTDPQKYVDAVAKIANNMKINCVEMKFYGNTEGLQLPEINKPDLDMDLRIVNGVKEMWSDVAEIYRFPELDAAIDKVETTKFGTKDQVLALKEFAQTYADNIYIHPMIDFTNILIDTAKHSIEQGDESFKDIISELEELNQSLKNRDQQLTTEQDFSEEYDIEDAQALCDREF